MGMHDYVKWEMPCPICKKPPGRRCIDLMAFGNPERKEPHMLRKDM